MRRSGEFGVTIALGGNAISRRGEGGTAQAQFETVKSTARDLAKMVKGGRRIVVTHGNGPQVGDILLRNEMAKEFVPPMPLDVCGAESQGMIGYMLQQALEEALAAEGLDTPAVTVLTQVVVDRADPAYKHPSKPVGPFNTPHQARLQGEERRWKMIEDAGRGYRRVVPSPIPRDIVEKETIERLFHSGVVVVAAGGGGIPVVRKGGTLKGIEAVLDKDRTASLLASILKTEVLLILTDVESVYLDYNGPRMRALSKVDAETCRGYLEKGHFPSGSMGPKIESAVEFLRRGGSKVVIASVDRATDALAGRAGTTITP